MHKKLRVIILAALLGSRLVPGYGQAHGVSDSYQKPTDPLVLQNLEEWQDMKFGLFMHWGTYSQWGVVESWSICPEDEDWTQRDPKHGATYFEYKKNYEDLQKTFNPTAFNPEKWAAAAKAAGMRYVVFTTKHHDGFNMYDTKYSDYKITDPKTPFSKNKRADITKEVFNTFRKDGFKIGAYFSKPDWHSEYYWWPYFPPKDRNVNYDPAKYPERWNNFKDFTYNQINELTSRYGKVDILWLDGGQVRPLTAEEMAVDIKRRKKNQDIDMDRIGTMARKNQPGIIVVDRTVPSKWENYVTPEQAIPDHKMDIPWESCITMGNSFSYVPNDKYKPAKKIVETLVQIISRGGNYLLNIAPGPTGDYDKVAYDRLHELAGWIKTNGTAVYATRPVAPYHTGDYYYTKSKDGKTVNVFNLREGDSYAAPKVMVFTLPAGFNPAVVNVLGYKGKVQYKRQGNSMTVNMPAGKCDYAAVVQMKAK